MHTYIIKSNNSRRIREPCILRGKSQLREAQTRLDYNEVEI